MGQGVSAVGSGALGQASGLRPGADKRVIGALDAVPASYAAAVGLP